MSARRIDSERVGRRACQAAESESSAIVRSESVSSSEGLIRIMGRYRIKVLDSARDFARSIGLETPAHHDCAGGIESTEFKCIISTQDFQPTRS